MNLWYNYLVVNMKTNIIYKHDNETFNSIGIKNDNIITFKNNDEMIKVTILDKKIDILKEKNDSIIHMIFDSNNITESIYDVYELGIVNLSIKTNKLIISDNSILIEYIILESNDFHTYELRWKHDN